MNSAPLAALFFCGVILAGRAGVVISSVLFLASFPLLSMLQGYQVGMDLVTSVIGFALIILLALKLQNARTLPVTSRAVLMVGGSLLCAAGYFFFTNTMSWLSLPFYDKSWEGFYQAQWGQHPSLAQPTWVFLRNSLVGNGIFSFLLCASQWRVNFTLQLNKITELN